jgi:malate/lactate dehydrogenase
LSMDVPLVIGSGGVHDIRILELTAEEQAGLKKTLSVLEPAMRQVDDFVKA